MGPRELPWALETNIVHVGASSVKSQNNGGFCKSWMRTRIKGPCLVRFHLWKNFHGSIFSIDCDETRIWEDFVPARNTPDSGWRPMEVRIPEGRHVLTFCYQHNGTGWVNQVNDVCIDGFSIQEEH